LRVGAGRGYFAVPRGRDGSAGDRANLQHDGENLLLDVEQETDLRRTYTMVARLAHQGVSQDQLERVLRDLYRDGNDTMRSALLESNEALNALGYSTIRYPDSPAD